MQFIRDVAHAAFPGAHSSRVRDRCFSNIYSQLAVIRCRYTSKMLTSAGGLQTERTGLNWLPGAAVPDAEVYC